MKAFADNKIKVLKMMIFFFDRVENIVGKGENAGYRHVLLFPQCFQRAFYPESLKVGIVWLRVENKCLICQKTESQTTVCKFHLDHVR